MSDYILAAASTCDLDHAYLDAHEIPFIPYTFEIDEKIYEDDCRPATKDQLYKAMRSGKQPRTSQISYFMYHEFFYRLMRSGKNVIFMDMCSALSNSFNNANQAAETIREEFPDQKLYVMDTRCVTIGLAMLIEDMVKQKEKGASFEELIEFGENTKLHIAHRFMVEDLQWLRRGGRLSNIEAMLGAMLNIKPLIYIPDDGSLVAHTKVRGRKKALQGLIEETKKDIGDPTGKRFIITHSDCPADAEWVKKMLYKTYPLLGEIEILELGPTIGCHVGPDFIGMVYKVEHRIP